MSKWLLGILSGVIIVVVGYYLTEGKGYILDPPISTVPSTNEKLCEHSSEVKPSDFVYIDSREPDANYYNEPYREIGQSLEWNDEQIILVKFDENDFPCAGTSGSSLDIDVTASTLQFTQADQLINVTKYAIRAITTDWDEQEITFRQKPKLENVTLYEGQFDTGANTLEGGSSFNSLIANWIKDPSSNFGIALQASSSVFDKDNSDRISDIQLTVTVSVSGQR